MELQEGYVKTDISNAIAAIEFFHPQSNSLPGNILSALADAIQKAGMDNAVKIIVLKSKGEKAFCAGASFTELAAIQNEKQGLEFFSGFARVINAMRKCPKFIIARIQGKCVGGGVGLAAAADYAIALNGADIKLSELAVGIGPFVVGPAVERKIGAAAFMALSIDATNWRSSNWAVQQGLFAEQHETVENLDTAVNTLAGTLAKSSTQAMAALKKIFWQDAENWDNLLLERAAISGTLVLSDYSKEAIAKFKAK